MPSLRFALLVLLGAGAAPLGAAPRPAPPAFAMCGVCHPVAKGALNRIGPNLWAVGGRKAGSVPGFGYSPAMKKAGWAWSKPTLTAFIRSPQHAVPGTRMAFAGQPNPALAGAIADYLLSLR